MTFVAGTPLSAAALNAALPGSIRCQGHLTATSASIAANTATRITGYTEDYETVAMMDGSTGLITIPSSGVYLVTAGMQINSFATAYRRSLVVETGSGTAGTGTELVRDEVESTDRVGLSIAKEIYLTAGTVISAYVNLEASGTIQGASYVCWFGAILMGA